MSGLRTICVFSGSSPGARPSYTDAATALGHEIASRGMRLVYGGACVGLMGTVADAALAAGGEVVGVHPRSTSSTARSRTPGSPSCGSSPRCTSARR